MEIRYAYEYAVTHCRNISSTFNTKLAALHRLKKSPDTFQKICQVSMAILQGINWCCNKSFLPKFIEVLDLANIDDFFEFITLPYKIFYKVKASRLDEYQLLGSLEETLSHNWNQVQDATIHRIAQQSLIKLLNQMEDKEICYRNPDDFKHALKKCLMQHPQVNSLEHNPQYINLKNMKVELQPIPLLEILSFMKASMASLGCVPAFLQEWGVINLSSISNTMGQYKVFGWFFSHSLDTTVRVCLCLGFFFQFLEAWRVLRDTHLSANEIIKARWDLLTSAGEFIYNFALFNNASYPWIILLTLIAKSMGLMSVMYKPKTLFFEKG